MVLLSFMKIPLCTATRWEYHLKKRRNGAMLDRLLHYFSYDIAWYALIVAVLVGLCASVFGVILVLKRMSFIGDGLSHVAFGATAVAAVIGLTNSVWIVMPVTMLSAVLLLRGKRSRRLHGDAAIAVISVGALGFGYLLMKIFPRGNANIEGDVCTSLFGAQSILNLELSEVIFCIVVAIVTIAVFFAFYNKIFSVTFDEDFSKAVGINTSRYNLMIALVTAVIIVLAMNLVGSLLASALIIFPALSSMRVCRSFKGVVICSAVISVSAAVVGLLLALLFSLPVGPTIVVVDIVVFGVFTLLGVILKR